MTDTLFAPRDIASLAFFRVAFGIIMLWEVQRYFSYRWIEGYFIDPGFNFTYECFHWVKPWPDDGMFVHFYLLGILSILIALGLFYRVSSILFFLGFTYIFLLEQARYLNHFYLVVLLSFLMIFIPSHRAYSVDSWLRPRIKSSTVPFWALFLLQFQIGVVYVLGAVAKMNKDWIHGEPMRHWLADRLDFPLIGQFFDREWAVYGMSYGGLLLDLAAPFLLLFGRTRPLGMTAVVIFHFMNDRLFSIGIFPWFMILASTLFFPSDWPRQFVTTIRENRNGRTAAILAGAVGGAFLGLFFHDRFELVPLLVSLLAGGIAVWTFQTALAREPGIPARSGMGGDPVAAPGRIRAAVVTGLVFVWVLVQILVPLRHFVIPGNVNWTEEGHRFSWHMKLREKAARVKFVALNSETQQWIEIDPREQLTHWQYRKMATRPYLILQFAQLLDRQLKESGHEGFEIRAFSKAGLNYRPDQIFIDPNVDLSRETFHHFRTNKWILPLEEAAITEP